MGEGETETDEETSANEHANTLGGGLEDSGNNLSIFKYVQLSVCWRERDRGRTHHDSSAQ